MAIAIARVLRGRYDFHVARSVRSNVADSRHAVATFATATQQPFPGVFPNLAPFLKREFPRDASHLRGAAMDVEFLPRRWIEHLGRRFPSRSVHRLEILQEVLHRAYTRVFRLAVGDFQQRVIRHFRAFGDDFESLLIACRGEPTADVVKDVFGHGA